MYRSVLADKRLLVVLDNAASPDQVRPLLPGSPGCLALVTSRDRLTGLVVREGARTLPLDILTRAESVSLLGRTVDAGRVATEPEAADALAVLCGHLPLALRIARGVFHRETADNTTIAASRHGSRRNATARTTSASPTALAAPSTRNGSKCARSRRWASGGSFSY